MIGHTAPLVPLADAQLPTEGMLGGVFTRVSRSVDAGMLRAVRIVVERALIPDPNDVHALRASAQPLLDPALQRNPGRYFDFLSEQARVLAISSEKGRRLPGGRVVTRRLASAYQPYHAERPGPSADRPRDPIRFEHWVHEGSVGARGTVVALHGFAMGHPRIDALVLFSRQWFERGLDVALLTLPQHGDRTPPDARFSGESFAVPDVARLSEAVRESIYEIRALTGWLRTQRDAPVGLIGISLGGYLAALAAGLMDDLDFVVPIVPPVCFGDLAWRVFERTRHAKQGGPAALQHGELRRAFRIHSPLAHPARIPKERLLIVAGRGDRVVPPEHPHALWKHWGEPRAHWFSGSHLAPFGRNGVVYAVDRHLRDNGVL